MAPNTYTRYLFWNALTCADYPGHLAVRDLAAVTGAIREAVKALGSETPDNVSCAGNIAYDELGDRYKELSAPQAGLVLAGSTIPLSAIAHELESGHVPANLAGLFPALTEEGWNAFTRLVTLLMIAIERPVKDGPSKRLKTD